MIRLVQTYFAPLLPAKLALIYRILGVSMAYVALPAKNASGQLCLDELEIVLAGWLSHDVVSWYKSLGLVRERLAV